MLKKKYQNRIDTLFTDLEQDTLPVTSPGELVEDSQASVTEAVQIMSGRDISAGLVDTLVPDGDIAGCKDSLVRLEDAQTRQIYWHWESDERGNYTDCGAAVREALGLDPAGFLGKPVTRYGLTPECSLELSRHVQDGEFPFEMDLDYVTSSGDVAQVRMYIYQAPLDEESTVNGGDSRGMIQMMRGISQVIDSGPIKHPSKRIKRYLNDVLKDRPEGVLAVKFQATRTDEGWLEVLDEDPHRQWTEDEHRLIDQVAEQLALALENAYLFQETEAALAEAETLYSITSIASRSLEIENILQDLLEQVINSTGMDAGLISRVNEQNGALELLAHWNLPEDWVAGLLSTGLGGTLCEAVYLSRNPLWVGDILPGDREDTVGLIKRGVRAYMGVPLESQGRVMGTLCAFSFQPRPELEQSLSLLQVAGQQIGIAIENANLFQQTQARAEEMSILHQLSEELVQEQRDLRGVLEIITMRIVELLDAQSSQVWLYQENSQQLELAFSCPPITEIQGEPQQPGDVESRQWDISTEGVITETYRSASSQVKEAGDGIVTLAVPMIWQTQCVGVLTVKRTYGQTAGSGPAKARSFAPTEQSLAELIAGQAATVVQNTRLFEETQMRADQLAVLNDMGRALTAQLEVEEVVERVYQYASRLIDTTNFYIALYDSEKDEVSFPYAVEENQRVPWRARKAGNGLTEYVIHQREPVLIKDNVSRWIEETFGIEQIGRSSHSWLGVPMGIGSQVVGVIAVQSYTTPRLYDESHRDLLAALASQTAIAIQNANLFQQTQAALGETAGLYQASAELNTAQSYQDILTVLQTHTMLGGAAHHVSLNYFDSPWTQEEVPEWFDVLIHWTDRADSVYLTRFPLRAYPSLIRLLKPDETLIIADLKSDMRLDETMRELFTRRYEAVSAIFIPLVVSGQWIGFINANYPESTEFPEKEIRRLMALAGQAAVAIQNLRSVAIAEQQAKEAQDRSEELSLINRVVSAMVSSSDLRQVLDAVAEELIKAFSLAHASIALLNEDNTHLTVLAEKSSRPETAAQDLKIAVAGNPAIEQVIASRRPIMITDAQASPMIAALHVLMIQRQVQTIALFPIIVGGEVIGIIALDVIEKGLIFTTQELALAETLVGQISTSIQNANLYEQTQRALAETEILYQASAELNAAQSYDEILMILRKSTVLGHQSAGVVTINLFDHPWQGTDRPDWLIPIAGWSGAAGTGAEMTRYLLSGWTSIDEVFRPEAPTFIPDAATDPRLDETARVIFLDSLAAKSLLFVPLIVGGQWIGQVIGIYIEKIQLTEGHMRPLMALSGQAAVAIQNLRLFDEIRRRAAQLETAAEIARDTSSTLALEALLNRAVNLIRERYGYYHASIFLLDETGASAIVRASTGEAGEEMKKRSHTLAVGSQSVIGYVTEAGTSLVVNDVKQNPIHRPNPLLPNTQAELAIPLKIGARIIGALDVQSSQLDAFSGDDVSVLQTLADQLAVAVDNARSYELAQQAIDETRLRMQELSLLFNIGQALANAPLESDQIALIVSRSYVEIFDVNACSVLVMDTSVNELRILAETQLDERSGSPAADKSGEVIYLKDSPLMGEVLDELQPIVVQSANASADRAELERMRRDGIKSELLLPLAIKGVALGIIRLEARDKERRFSPEQINLAMTVSNLASTALENARLYQEQRQTAEQLREVDQLKTQFLANMSHELRTPLNSIIGFSRVILKGIDGPISELQKQDLSAINSSGQHLLHLINDVLDISKIEAGKMELAFDDEVNLADLINSTMSTAVGLVKDKPIKLEREIQADLPPVRADATRIRQVLINFLSNAAKFTEEGKIVISAHVQTDSLDNPEVLVSVTDTGPGIAEEHQAMLFQPFSQVDSSPTRKVGGTGLGLSISRLLIELHGGRIGLKSALGQGSTFYFTLPLPVKEPVVQKGGDKKVILAVDDNQQVIWLYERYLEAHDFQVVPVTDPCMAVEMARKVQPFAITLDVMMPNTDGWQVLAALKEDPVTRSIPVVMCTIVEEQERGFSLGAVGYLTKPILEEDLIGALDQLNGDGLIHEVLVVDDDPDVLSLVQRSLRNNPAYHVRLAHGGPEGLVAIQTQPPDAIVLDLFMPDLDGFTLLETVRENPKLRKIPVIIFTAGDLTYEQSMRLSEFSQRMLHKGVFNEEELLANIESALKQFTPTGS